MKTISSDDARLLFGKWKEEESPINLIAIRAGGIAAFFDKAVVEEVEEDAVGFAIGDFGRIVLEIRRADFRYLEPHEIPREYFDEVGPRFDSCLRIGLSDGSLCLLLEMKQ